MCMFLKFFVIIASMSIIHASSEAFETFTCVVGCKIVLRWRSTHVQFQVVIRKKDDPKYSLSLVTEANSFTYHDAEPGQMLSVAWIPVGGNNRAMLYLQKVQNVRVRSDCMNQVFLSTPKLSKNQNTSMLPDCLSRSSTVPPIHLESTNSGHDQNPLKISGSNVLKTTMNETFTNDNFKTSFSLPVFQTTKNDPFSNDFCRIYFWTSLSSIPVLACIVSVTLYLCVIRKSHKAIQNGNASTKKRSDVNVKSTCYANDGENEYHEVQYCLAQYTEN